MIRVAYGATVLGRGLAGDGIDGIGTYTQELARALHRDRLASLTPVTFGLELPPMALPGQDRALALPPYAPQALLSAATTAPFRGARQLRQGADLFHATDHLVPRLSHTPVLATVMDAIPLEHPEWLGSRAGSVKARLWRHMTRHAQHIVTISGHARETILAQFDLPPERVTAIPLGVRPQFFNRLTAAQRHQILERHGLPGSFLLSVGTLQPRKNIDRVIDAHQRLPQAVRHAFPLVIVGRAGWACTHTVERLARLAQTGEAHWLARITDDALQGLMQAATALVFPSLSEGFGLPVLEAFASGLPVITSNTTSLPEVAGDAALLVDPRDTDAIHHALERMLDDAELRQRLGREGRCRARQFRWEATARATADLYRALIN